MVEHNPNGPAAERTPQKRYRYVEYVEADGTVSFIQDTQNEHAWIRSTHAVTVEP
jgi:hypothetical protein